MLSSLTIEGFVLIERLHLGFAPGVCVLTGETGAGKSIVIDAVSALLGGRAGPDLIRTGSDRARLEATFTLAPAAAEVHAWLEAAGVEPAVEGELTLSREITPKGSRCRVEGVQVSLAALRELGEHLVDILGQHEHTLLTRAREHLGLLDRFGGPEQEALRDELAAAHAAWSTARTERRALIEAAAERARQRDFWAFQLAEITEAEPIAADEEQRLGAERALLANAESLKRTLVTVHEVLSQGEHPLTDALSEQIGELRSASAGDPVLGEVIERLDEALDALEAASRTLRQRSERCEPDPERLAEIDRRLDVLGTLQRKYGPTLSDVVRYRDRIQVSLTEAESADQRLAALEADEQRYEARWSELAGRLSARRREAARRLEERIETELAELSMKGARFAVELRAHTAPTAEGAESAEFLLAANPGEPPRPLARTASGGELARIMLALKTVLVRGEATPTLVFDEVDTGISGRAAQVVAQKLAQLGARGQILLITHMPAIAAIADAHWHIEKRIAQGRTWLSIDRLDAEGQIAELAHLASGDASSGAASTHARELLERARRFKQAVAP